MDTLSAAIVGLNVTLVGALIWVLRYGILKLFGAEGKRGVVGELNDTLQEMNTDIRENTLAIREFTSTQVETNRTLQAILREQETNHGETTTSPD
jgi:hypothetical protein